MLKATGYDAKQINLFIQHTKEFMYNFIELRSERKN